jgi:hypothetical protein
LRGRPFEGQMSVGHSLGASVGKQLRSASDRVFMRYLHRGEVEIAALTGAELDAAARRVAAGLLARGLEAISRYRARPKCRCGHALSA